MAEETQISTPVETVDVDTSSSVEPAMAETSTEEPAEVVETAETETENASVEENAPQEERMYAGKYKTVEELEKGYAETQKFVQKASELEKKLHALEQQKQEETLKAQQQALEQAKARGFETIEAQEIADKVQVAELEYYANNLNRVSAEKYEECRQALASYYQTGNKQYLDYAKTFFDSDFVEQVAIKKSEIKARMQGEYNQKQQQQFAEREQKLADTLRGEFKEFLDSIKDNEIVQQALKMYCDTGHIQSKEDMQVFINHINGLQNYYKELAIKEYEAQKAIEETKAKAQIEANTNFEVEADSIPTYAQLSKMTQAEYEEAYAKFGDKLLLAK